MQSAQTPELPCLCFYPKFVVQTLKIEFDQVVREKTFLKDDLHRYVVLLKTVT